MSLFSVEDNRIDFAELQNVPLLILHPNFRNQYRLLPKLLDRSGVTNFFVMLTHTHTSDSDLRDLITEAVETQSQVRLHGLSPDQSPDDWARDLIGQLVSVAPFTLILDAIDLARPAEAAALVKGLIDAMPRNSQVILSGRQLVPQLTSDESLQGRMVLLPLNSEEMLIDYTRKSPDQVLLEVYSLGAGRALINGQRIEEWDGMLPRALFFYLVDRGMTTRDEIFQTFWPNLPVREATNVFHVTKRKISEILGFDLTTYWSGFYRISPDVDLHYDVVTFAEAVQNSAVMDDDEALDVLSSAIGLYRGSFLSTLEADWVDARRIEMSNIFCDALTALARVYESQSALEQALGLYLRAAAKQPQREDLARSIMSLYDTIGQPTRAVEVYERLTLKLKQILNVEPDKRTAELAQQIHAQAQH